MSALREKRIPITYDVGMYPVPDSTQLMSTRVVDGDRIRFSGNVVWQIGGWVSVKFDQLGENQTLDGCARMLFSFIDGNNRWYLIGTSTGLYSLLNNALTNITPIGVDTVTLGNDPIDALYDNFQTNPFFFVNGSNIVTVLSNYDVRLNVGDFVTITGAAGTINGVPSTQLNGFHTIVSKDVTDNLQIQVATAATSGGNPAVPGVVTVAPYVQVEQTAHGYSVGQRIRIENATGPIGGVPDTEINAEHIVHRVVDADHYMVAVDTYPTSTAAGGGASVDVTLQIDAGECDNAPGVGYGMGLYGVGLYGVSKMAYLATSIKELRLWSADRFGSYVALTPGNQSPLYIWTVDNDTAPAPVTGDDPPDAVNYVFTTDNFLCFLGPDGEEDKVGWASQGTTDTYTPDATNTAGSNSLRDAGRLISQINVRGTNLIFSQTLVYTMRFVEGSPYVFQFSRLDGGDGIIGQNARVSHKGVAYWIGSSLGFFKYDGGIVREIGDASDQEYITIKQYFMARLTTSQRQKICAGVVRQYDEIWWFYPSQDSSNEHGYNENDSYIIHDTVEGWWAYGTLARTAIEYPAKIGNNQYMVGADNKVYAHEQGVNDDTEPMNAFADLRIAMAGNGDDYIEITGFMADAIITGNLKVTYFTKRFPQSPTETEHGPYTVTATTDLKRLRAYGRQRKIRVETDELDSSFQLGAFYEYAKTGGQR